VLFRTLERHAGRQVHRVDDVNASAREAFDLYNLQRDDWHAGRTPRPRDNAVYTLRDLNNDFLTSKQNKLESGESSRHTFWDYHRSCTRMIEHFGPSRRRDDLRLDDFERFRKKLAKKFSVVTLKNGINHRRIVLKYAHDQQKIDRPVSYGQSFEKAAARTQRKARNQAGLRLFEADELRRIIDAADPWLRAMTLLGINGGLGNTDIANLHNLRSTLRVVGSFTLGPRLRYDGESRCGRKHSKHSGRRSTPGQSRRNLLIPSSAS